MEPEGTLKFLAPENASLAQGLLQIILDKAHVEMFSSSGGGVAVMLLERWQIDILADFGVCFEERFSPLALPRQQQVRQIPRLQPEYISVLEERADKLHRKFGEDPEIGVNDDILSDWLSADADSSVAATPSD